MTNQRIPTYRVENPVPMKNRESRAAEQAVISVYQFAGAIDSNPQTVYRWLRGDVSPRVELLVAICEAYAISADWLLGLTETPFLTAPRSRRF